ncbi:hypothetical protein ACWGE0_39500 [Lentzea sp. NPDC054927]
MRCGGSTNRCGTRPRSRHRSASGAGRRIRSTTRRGNLAEEIGAAGSFDHGAHDGGYWRRVLPEALRFIGNRL